MLWPNRADAQNQKKYACLLGIWLLKTQSGRALKYSLHFIHVSSLNDINRHEA